MVNGGFDIEIVFNHDVIATGTLGMKGKKAMYPLINISQVYIPSTLGKEFAEEISRTCSCLEREYRRINKVKFWNMYTVMEWLNEYDLFIRNDMSGRRGTPCFWISTLHDPSVGIFGAEMSPTFIGKYREKKLIQWMNKHYKDIENVLDLIDKHYDAEYSKEKLSEEKSKKMMDEIENKRDSLVAMK